MIRAQLPGPIYDTYGCAYPITYIFAIPAGSSGLSARSRAVGQDWRSLPSHTSRATVVSGELGVRFDYAASRAYVSAGFGPNGPDLWVKVIDADGEDVGTYLGTADYYDAAKAACVLTYDDWNGPDHFVQTTLVKAHAARGLWASIGINGSNISTAQWAEMNALINTVGHFEPINHGHTHAAPNQYGTFGLPEAEFAAQEISRGRQSILDNVKLPWQSRQGDREYVNAWIRPFNQTTTVARATLVAQDYLIERTTSGDRPQFWEVQAADGLYSTDVAVAVRPLANDFTTAKQIFDDSYAQNAIFHGYGYAIDYNWQDPAAPVLDFLNYISGYDDVWYVGYGHHYQYHHAQTNLTVSEEGPSVTVGYGVYVNNNGVPELAAELPGAVEGHTADLAPHPGLFEARISRTSAAAGNVPVLQPDGTFMLQAPSSGTTGLWNLVEQFTLGADSETFTVAGLDTRSHVRITMTGVRRSTSGGNEGLMVRVNGDTSAAYNWVVRETSKPPTAAPTEATSSSATALVTAARLGTFYPAQNVGTNRAQIVAIFGSDFAHFQTEVNGENGTASVITTRGTAGWRGTGTPASLTFSTASGAPNIFRSGLRVIVESLLPAS